MTLLALGHSQKSAADDLGISSHTIEKHRNAVYYKWSVNSTLAMIRVGLRSGELSLKVFLASSVGENSRHEKPGHLPCSRREGITG